MEGAAISTSRVTVFAPRIDAVLQKHVGSGVFRLEKDTLGVADPVLMDEVLGARSATEFERPTFKPLTGRSIPRGEASALMQAVGQDVRVALRTPMEERVDFSGQWPQVGHYYLRDLVFGGDPRRMTAMVHRSLELTPKLTWAVVAAGAGLPGWPSVDTGSALARRTAAASTYEDRRRALGLYRRVAAPICFTVAAMVTGALWLGSPFDDEVSNEHILLETLRLLPVSWNLLRRASPEFTALDDRFGAADDLLLLPLLSHRDPALWEAPAEFRPQRWRDLDPDTHPGYLPFGHSNERCWGRHMVMPLASRMLDLLRRDGYAVSAQQTKAHVPLAGLLEVVDVRVRR
ncbi:LigA protein [Kutzneria sp. 744]|nr:LigA protein [Kutzneria sp. 744]